MVSFAREIVYNGSIRLGSLTEYCNISGIIRNPFYKRQEAML